MSRADIKVGDEVVVSDSRWNDTICVVTGVTETQIKIDDRSYMKKSGVRVGQAGFRFPEQISGTSPEAVKHVREQEEIKTIRTRIERIAREQSLDVLRQINALLVEP